MSEADKMFEELGYENYKTIDCISYIREEFFENHFKNIMFDIEHNLINIRTDNSKNLQTITSILSMQELQAINGKCKELGWLE